MSANTAEFDKDMKRARGIVRDTTRSMTDRFAGFRASIANTIKSIFSFRNALIALAGVAALGFLIKKNIEAADAIAKTADRIGIGIEALQEYQHAANLAGVSNQQLEKAFQQLNRNVSQAANGLQTYARAFDMAGVSLTDHEGKLKRNEVLFEELADAIANTEDATRRADIVMTVFGRAGAQLLPLFKDGAEGIRQMRQEARDLGLVLNEDMAREAERANDQLDRMFRVLNTQLTRVVVSLAPQIVRLGEAFLSVVPDIIAFANRFLPDEFLPIEGLRTRIDEVEAEIHRLTGFTMRDILDSDASLGEMFGSQTEQVRALLVELRDLDDLIKKRVRQDAMLRAEMEATGEETEATTDKVGDLREELQFELDQLQRNSTEQEIYNLARRAGVEVTDEFRATIQPLVEALEDEERATALATDAAETHQRTMDRGAAVTREVRTALDIYNEDMAELTYLLEIGAINQETFARATERARESLEDAEKTTDRSIDLARDLGMTFSSAFEDAIVGGEKLSDVLRGLEQDIIRLITRQLIIAPLADAGTNILSDLIGAGLPSLFGGGMSAPSGLGAGVNRGFASGGMHRGGFRIVGEQGRELEATGPARYYSADKTSELLAGGGGDVQVNVYAPPGSTVEQRESQGPGGRTLDIILDEATARAIGTPGSRTARAMRTAFQGVNPQLQAR
jgi:hypothetical protein